MRSSPAAAATEAVAAAHHQCNHNQSESRPSLEGDGSDQSNSRPPLEADRDDAYPPSSAAPGGAAEEGGARRQRGGPLELDVLRHQLRGVPRLRQLLAAASGPSCGYVHFGVRSRNLRLSERDFSEFSFIKLLIPPSGQKHRLRAIRRGLKPDQAAASPSSSTLTSASESDDCTTAAAAAAASKKIKASKAAASDPPKAEKAGEKVKGQKGHRHRSLTANGRPGAGRGGGAGEGGPAELSRHLSSSCLAAARLYYSSPYSRSTSSLRKAVSHGGGLNKSRSMNLLNHGFGGPAHAQQRPPFGGGRLRQWDMHFDDSTSNEEGEVDDEDEIRPREDESGDQDEDAAEAKGGRGDTAERAHQRSKVGKSGQSQVTC